VDVVLDVVGGDGFTDSLRCLAEQGRLLVVGFAGGQGIPTVKVNRLLLGNIDVRGVGWGAYAMTRPPYMREQWARLLPLIESGAVRPPIGTTYVFEEFGRALADMDDRRTLGKSVVHVH
jgi:NADPH2:quinone reductase